MVTAWRGCGDVRSSAGAQEGTHRDFGPSSQQRRLWAQAGSGKGAGSSRVTGQAAWRSSHIPSLLETGALSGKVAGWETWIQISGLAAFATTGRFSHKTSNNHCMLDSLPLLSSPTPANSDVHVHPDKQYFPPSRRPFSVLTAPRPRALFPP